MYMFFTTYIRSFNLKMRLWLSLEWLVVSIHGMGNWAVSHNLTNDRLNWDVLYLVIKQMQLWLRREYPFELPTLMGSPCGTGQALPRLRETALQNGSRFSWKN